MAAVMISCVSFGGMSAFNSFYGNAIVPVMGERLRTLLVRRGVFAFFGRFGRKYKRYPNPGHYLVRHSGDALQVGLASLCGKYPANLVGHLDIDAEQFPYDGPIAAFRGNRFWLLVLY